MLVSDYSFWEVLSWTMCSSRSSSGSGFSSRSSETSSALTHCVWRWGGKTLWIIFIILLPFSGVFIYLISQGKGMAERNMWPIQVA